MRKLKIGYELKKIIPVLFCDRCKKRTRHNYYYERKTKKCRVNLVYRGCSCGISLSLVGYLDKHKNVILFKNQSEFNDLLISEYLNWKRECHTNPKKARPKAYKQVIKRIKEFEKDGK